MVIPMQMYTKGGDNEEKALQLADLVVSLLNKLLKDEQKTK